MAENTELKNKLKAIEDHEKWSWQNPEMQCSKGHRWRAKIFNEADCRICALDATTKDLSAALVKAAEQFRFYQQQHMAKMPPDISKADTNKVYADMCDAARAKVQS